MTTVTTDHLKLAREFLHRSYEYLGQGDLHQASEKGWGAAAHLAKAIAASQGWEYVHHDQFDSIIENARHRFRQPSLRQYGEAAHFLHRNYYKHPSFLDADPIRERITDVATMLDVLEPFLHPPNVTR